jgi:hypothetical protein
MSELKIIFDFFKEYGIVGLLVTTTLTIIIKTKALKYLWTFLTDYIVEKFILNKTKDLKNTGVKISESDVINHDIFNYIDLWSYSKVPTIQFSSEYRTVVFRKYLFIFLKCYKNNIRKFITEGHYKSMDNAQLWQGFLKLITDIVYDYEKEMRELGIPNIIIEKMKIKNNEMINLIIDLIEGISTSTFYDSENNLLKVYSILNIILSILENTISSSDSICNSINGQLKGLTFNDGGKIVKEP